MQTSRGDVEISSKCGDVLGVLAGLNVEHESFRMILATFGVPI